MFFRETRLVRNPRVVWNVIEDETILLDREEGEAIRLNSVAGAIWTSLEKARTMEEVVQDIIILFDADPQQVGRDVRRFLKKMLRQEILLKEGRT
ncbi:MAG: PqqD family protein [Deltaproteobacteria bacterium]|nr:PqqD family protein [Deltaproteobacteria bacterium]